MSCPYKGSGAGSCAHLYELRLSPKYGPHYLPFHLSTEPNLSSPPKKETEKDGDKTYFFLCNLTFFLFFFFFFLLNKEAITPYFPVRRVSIVLFLKEMFPVVVMLILIISSLFLVQPSSLKNILLIPALQSLIMLC